MQPYYRYKPMESRRDRWVRRSSFYSWSNKHCVWMERVDLPKTDHLFQRVMIVEHQVYLRDWEVID